MLQSEDKVYRSEDGKKLCSGDWSVSLGQKIKVGNNRSENGSYKHLSGRIMTITDIPSFLFKGPNLGRPAWAISLEVNRRFFISPVDAIPLDPSELNNKDAISVLDKE